MIGLLALTAFAALLIYAACSDIARLTIPNWVSIALAALFVPAALAAGVPLAQIGAHLLFGAAMLAGGFFLFQASIIGGGDAKLLAGAAVWTGFQAFPPFIFWTAAAGGVLALSLIAARRCLKQAATNPAFVNHLLERQTGVPYAVAIMTGGLMALPALSLALSPVTTP
jgi:prepilin peptidase CpaA